MRTRDTVKALLLLARSEGLVHLNVMPKLTGNPTQPVVLRATNRKRRSCGFWIVERFCHELSARLSVLPVFASLCANVAR